MPEKVTREERIISMTIEKARKAKELLRESMEGNRLPDEKDDRMEKVKVKRPKAEKDKTKIENNDGTHSGYGKGGEETHFKKSQILSKRQTPTSFEQVVQMANEKLQSGGVGGNKEILSNIASLAKQEIRNGSQFSEAKLKEIIETASRYNAIKDYMGLN